MRKDRRVLKLPLFRAACGHNGVKSGSTSNRYVIGSLPAFADVFPQNRTECQFSLTGVCMNYKVEVPEIRGVSGNFHGPDLGEPSDA